MAETALTIRALRVRAVKVPMVEPHRTASGTIVESPLVLTKWSDKDSAEIGDEVTFTLRYSNPGGLPITDVVVSDSLTGRLEYVPGSAQTSHNAVFTTQPNESGSLILHWQINGALQPGETGVVRFKVRVR